MAEPVPSSPPAGDDLRVEVDRGVVTLTLDRPQARNALSPAMRDALGEAVARIEADPALKVVVLRGAGGHFCAGGDVRAMAAGDADTPLARLARMRAWHPTIQRLAQLDRPVIAAVQGVAFGAGFGLALLADIVLVDDTARLCMGFQRVGLVPDFGASYTLPRAVGLQRAREMFLSAREIGADEAVRLGLALEVVAPATLDARARELALALAQASPVANGLSKRLLQCSLNSSLSQMLEMESSAQAVAATSAYAREAFRAFAERRPAVFRWPPAA